MQFDFIKHFDITENLIYEISKLKIQHWNYPIEEQIIWFIKNVKKDDVHLLLYYENELIGYMLITEINVKKKSILENILELVMYALAIPIEKDRPVIY